MYKPSTEALKHMTTIKPQGDKYEDQQGGTKSSATQKEGNTNTITNTPTTTTSATAKSGRLSPTRSKRLSPTRKPPIRSPSAASSVSSTGSAGLFATRNDAKPLPLNPRRSVPLPVPSFNRKHSKGRQRSGTMLRRTGNQDSHFTTDDAVSGEAPIVKVETVSSDEEDEDDHAPVSNVIVQQPTSQQQQPPAAPQEMFPNTNNPLSGRMAISRDDVSHLSDEETSQAREALFQQQQQQLQQMQQQMQQQIQHEQDRNSQLEQQLRESQRQLYNQQHPQQPQQQQNQQPYNNQQQQQRPQVVSPNNLSSYLPGSLNQQQQQQQQQQGQSQQQDWLQSLAQQQQQNRPQQSSQTQQQVQVPQPPQPSQQSQHQQEEDWLQNLAQQSRQQRNQPQQNQQQQPSQMQQRQQMQQQQPPPQTNYSQQQQKEENDWLQDLADTASQASAPARQQQYVSSSASVASATSSQYQNYAPNNGRPVPPANTTTARQPHQWDQMSAASAPVYRQTNPQQQQPIQPNPQQRATPNNFNNQAIVPSQQPQPYYSYYAANTQQPVGSSPYNNPQMQQQQQQQAMRQRLPSDGSQQSGQHQTQHPQAYATGAMIVSGSQQPTQWQVTPTRPTSQPGGINQPYSSGQYPMEQQQQYTAPPGPVTPQSQGRQKRSHLENYAVHYHPQNNGPPSVASQPGQQNYNVGYQQRERAVSQDSFSSHPSQAYSLDQITPPQRQLQQAAYPGVALQQYGTAETPSSNNQNTQQGATPQWLASLAHHQMSHTTTNNSSEAPQNPQTPSSPQVVSPPQIEKRAMLQNANSEAFPGAQNQMENSSTRRRVDPVYTNALHELWSQADANHDGMAVQTSNMGNQRQQLPATSVIKSRSQASIKSGAGESENHSRVSNGSYTTSAFSADTQQHSNMFAVQATQPYTQNTQDVEPMILGTGKLPHEPGRQSVPMAPQSAHSGAPNGVSSSNRDPTTLQSPQPPSNGAQMATRHEGDSNAKKAPKKGSSDNKKNATAATALAGAAQGAAGSATENKKSKEKPAPGDSGNSRRKGCRWGLCIAILLLVLIAGGATVAVLYFLTDIFKSDSPSPSTSAAPTRIPSASPSLRPTLTPSSGGNGGTSFGGPGSSGGFSSPPPATGAPVEATQEPVEVDPETNATSGADFWTTGGFESNENITTAPDETLVNPDDTSAPTEDSMFSIGNLTELITPDPSPEDIITDTPTFSPSELPQNDAAVLSNATTNADEGTASPSSLNATNFSQTFAWEDTNSTLYGLTPGAQVGSFLATNTDGTMVVVGGAAGQPLLVYRMSTTSSSNASPDRQRVGDPLIHATNTNASAVSAAMDGTGLTILVGYDDGSAIIFALDRSSDDDDNPTEEWFPIGDELLPAGRLNATNVSVAISKDGLVLAVGVVNQSNSNANANVATVHPYIYSRTLDSYVSLDSNIRSSGDQVTVHVDLSANGQVLAVGFVYVRDEESRGEVKTYDLEVNGNRSVSTRGAFTLFGVSNLAVALSSNGNTMAVTSDKLSTVHGYSNEAQAWQVDSGGYLLSAGTSVQLSDDGTILVVGDANAVSTYEYTNAWWAFHPQRQRRRLELSGDDDSFGATLALSGDGTHLSVGAPLSDEGWEDAGKVYFYDAVALNNNA